MDFIKTLLLLFTLSFVSCSQVYAWDKTKSIGSPDLDFSSVFQVNTTDRGSIPCPKMTLAERDLIIAPTSGLCIYNTTTDSFENFNGIVWKKMGGGLSQWKTSTVYKIDDVVHENNKIYKALTDHTSGTFLTDLGNGDWVEISDDLNRELDGTVADKALVIWDGTSGDNVLTSDILLDAGAFDFLQTTTPTNPIAGREKLYFKSDDKLYKLTNGGIESEVGASVSFLDDNRLLKSDTVGSDNLQQSGVVLNDTNDMSGVNDIAANGIVTSQTPTISNFKEVGEKFKGDENYFSRGQSDYGLVADWVGANLTQDTTASNFLTGEFSVWKWTDTATISNQLVSQIINIPKGMRQSNIGYRFRYKYDGDDSDVDFLVQCVDDSRYIVADGDHKLSAYTATDGSALATGDFSPSGCTQVKVLFKVQVANSGKNLFFDSVVVSPADRTVKSITETEVVSYDGYLSRNGSNYHRLANLSEDSSRNIVEVSNVDHTRFTILKDCNVNVVLNFSGGSSINARVSQFSELDVRIRSGRENTAANGLASMSITGKANPGDYFVVDAPGAGDNNFNHNFSITATADADSVVRQTSSGDVDSSIRLSGQAVTASTNTYFMTIPTTDENIGGAITYTRDTILGDTWTINEDGIYSISAHLVFGAVDSEVYHGFTKNSTLNTYIESGLIPDSKILGMSSSSRGLYGGGNVSVSPYLKKGDVVRWVRSNDIIYTSGTQYPRFTISKAKVNPTVVIPFDDEYQNEFSASWNIQTNSKISDNYSFITSVDILAVGRFRVNFKPGFFTAIPSITGNAFHNSGVASGGDVSFAAPTTLDNATFYIDDSSGSNFNPERFDIHVSRQGSDFKKKTGFEVVRVAGTRTCIIEDRKSGGTNGGTAVANAMNVRTLNTATDDCESVELINGTLGQDGTANQLRLKKGKYNIDCSAFGYRVGENQLSIYSITSAAYLKTGDSMYAHPAGFVAQKAHVRGVFNISVDDYVIELRHWVEGTVANNDFGITTSSRVGNDATYNVYSQCKIQKVR